MRKLGYVAAVLVLLWMIASIIEVWAHSMDNGYVYSKANLWALLATKKTDMRVVDCEVYSKADDNFLVTVEDMRGNRYGYYDTEPRETETVLTITLQGNAVIGAE